MTAKPGALNAARNTAIAAAAAVLAAAALLAAWSGYARPDIVRWFGAFLMCG